jgi:transposase
MPRCKSYDYNQTIMIPLPHVDQIQPGSCEHTLSEVIDSIDPSLFSDRYLNDTSGAPAYDPAILLKHRSIFQQARQGSMRRTNRIKCRQGTMWTR